MMLIDVQAHKAMALPLRAIMMLCFVFFRSSPPISQPPVSTQIATPDEIVAPAHTPPPIHASTPEAFVFMQTPGINIQTMGSSSQLSPHEESEDEDEAEDEVVPSQEDEVEDQDEEESEDEDEEDEAEVGGGSFPPHLPGRDGDGKIKIYPYGNSLVPSKDVADAIRVAIQTQFRRPIHGWSATTKKIRDRWFEKFGEKLSWDPSLTGIVRHLFEQKAKRRLTDMLTKQRKKNVQPKWMGDKAWKGLIAYWAKPEFQNISKQNKINRASTKGGAVHTSGCKAHIDVALELCNEMQREVRPDELFLKTHKRKSGAWVEPRAEITCETYKENMAEVVGSEHDDEPVDGAVAIDCWVKAVGPPKRRRLYGTGGLSVNARRGSKSLMQPSQNHSSFNIATALEEERAARRRAEKIAEDALARADVAAQEAREANELLQNYGKDFNALKDRMDAMERQSGGARHPHYDDNMDEMSEQSD